jgi:hypothetical protein
MNMKVQWNDTVMAYCTGVLLTRRHEKSVRRTSNLAEIETKYLPN